MAMLQNMRRSCVAHLRSSHFGLTLKSMNRRSYGNLFRDAPRRVLILKKIGNCENFAKVKFHTTRKLDIPPVLALIIRPLINVGAFLFGRFFKRWWARQTPEQREVYKKWFASKRGVFLGILGGFLSGLGIYYVQHLETDPLTQRSRFILLNKEQQDALARLTYETHLAQHEGNLLQPNHPIYKKIAAVTTTLLRANTDLPFVKENTWTLNVINSDVQNAYVLPGGHIFVFVGTLKMVENDDQLAIILAHEMAHVLLKHPIEQISNGVILDLLLAVPLTILWAMFPDLVAFALQSLGKTMVAIVLSLPYTRSLEREADEVGLNLAARACVDVREAVVFWGTMKALVDMKVGAVEIPWLSTHPDNAERQKFLEERMPKALELRMQSGCLNVRRNDPRRLFEERSRKEQEALLKARGYIFI